MSTYRYVKTKVDNEPTILMLTRCNKCPFFNLVGYSGRCNKLNKQVKKVVSYQKNTHRAYTTEKVEIPTDCPLPCHLTNKKNTYIENAYYYNSKGKFRIENSSRLNRVLCDNFAIMSKNGCKLKRNKTKLHSNDKVGNPRLKKTKPLIDNKSKICSCCGEESNTVNRLENLGTCDKCWPDIKDDNVKKYRASIVNLRIRRFVPWIDNTKIEIVQ